MMSTVIYDVTCCYAMEYNHLWNSLIVYEEIPPASILSALKGGENVRHSSVRFRPTGQSRPSGGGFSVRPKPTGQSGLSDGGLLKAEARRKQYIFPSPKSVIILLMSHGQIHLHSTQLLPPRILTPQAFIIDSFLAPVRKNISSPHSKSRLL